MSLFRDWMRLAQLVCCAAAAATAVGPGRLQAEEHVQIPAITIHARQFAFVPSEITLHVGQAVRLVFVSDDLPHAVSVSELAIELPIQKRPSSVVVTPEKIAELTGRCSRYCGSGHSEMLLTIHVVE